MFKKVLVAEDFDTINISASEAFKELSISDFHHAKFCDEAYIKIRKAIHEKNPFDLFISDLTFLADGRSRNISTGEDLIAEVKRLQPELKVIAFSTEDRPFKIRSLFVKHNINGYVFKGRNSFPELKKAIRHIYHNDETYLSSELAHIKNDKSISEIGTYDIELLRLLAEGCTQAEIAARLKSHNISPSSTSAVEKRINRLKIYFQANNNVQIVVMAKDMGLI